jgi:DNA-binding IclR family transcriptional regulator
VGKALLMCLSKNEVRRICQLKNLIRRTERTITSPDVLVADYAVDDAEDEGEGRCFVAPILKEQGQVVASRG